MKISRMPFKIYLKDRNKKKTCMNRQRTDREPTEKVVQFEIHACLALSLPSGFTRILTYFAVTPYS